jgi:hypothetical protein
MRGTVTEGAFRFGLFDPSVFVHVRGRGIEAFSAVQSAMDPGQGKCRTTVVEVAVAFAAFARNIFILDRLDDLAVDGHVGQGVALPATDVFVKQLQ